MDIILLFKQKKSPFVYFLRFYLVEKEQGEEQRERGTGDPVLSTEPEVGLNLMTLRS